MAIDKEPTSREDIEWALKAAKDYTDFDISIPHQRLGDAAHIMRLELLRIRKGIEAIKEHCGCEEDGEDGNLLHPSFTGRPCGICLRYDMLIEGAWNAPPTSSERPANAISPTDRPSSERPAKHQSHCRAPGGFTCSCVKNPSVTEPFV